MKVGLPTRAFDASHKTLWDPVQTAYQWFTKTPERALEQAYQAVLNIQAIERQYFDGNDIDLTLTRHPTNVMACLRTDLDRYLNTAKLRVAEFKLSRAMLGRTDYALLEKLAVIDQLLAKYEAKLTMAKNTRLTTVPPERLQADLDMFEGAPPAHESSKRKSVLPRSIGRTVNRITTELNPNSEKELLTNFRHSSTKTRVALKFLALLILVPILTQQLSKNFLIEPIVERFHRENSAQAFLNVEMKEEALQELEAFEKELRFQNLLATAPQLSTEAIETQVHAKAVEIAEHYRDRGSHAIGNVFADLLGLFAFCWLLVISPKQIAVLKSFIDDIVYGLSDSAKAFIIILLTDIFVGYHSTHGWEVLLEEIANHLGIAVSRNGIFLFIATFPVILDTVFKYWIFRYLSRTSPSAVATLKNMNE
ncbi:MAG: proton extrusion protein PcxA [Trichocoleus desertorum ATA4-8-CV12]|jgi:hypothetical protein|nr:proton extrusion protein PcxA [Trichocoleus desertorum ATA4-8-CV12]